jgi:hypothetical protein
MSKSTIQKRASQPDGRRRQLKRNRRGRSVTDTQEYLAQLSNPSVSFESDEMSRPYEQSWLPLS